MTPATKSQNSWTVTGILVSSLVLAGVSGGLYPQDFLARFARPSEKTGLYISLKLKNDLGLVAPGSNILPFNADDSVYAITERGKIEFKNSDYVTESSTLSKLSEFIRKAEFELISHIRMANSILESRNLQPIQFQYPFAAHHVAESLCKQFNQLSTSSSEANVPACITSTDRKILVLRSIFQDICAYAVRDAGILDNGQRSVPRYRYPLPASFISPEAYEKFFSEGLKTES